MNDDALRYAAYCPHGTATYIRCHKCVTEAREVERHKAMITLHGLTSAVHALTDLLDNLD